MLPFPDFLPYELFSSEIPRPFRIVFCFINGDFDSLLLRFDLVRLWLAVEVVVAVLQDAPDDLSSVLV